ncbi:MAG TPA: hypothetical protein DCR64_01470, partial [Vibrio sp.]|nr:hypothetical protein [Vibrio sp.]
MTKDSRLINWLELVQNMLPDASVALLYSPELFPGHRPWKNVPETFRTSDHLIKLIQLAYHQQKICFAQEPDKTISIALPVLMNSETHLKNPILFIEMSAKKQSIESIQSICQWAAKWLAELLILEVTVPKQLPQTELPRLDLTAKLSLFLRASIDNLKAKKGVSLSLITILLLIMLIPLEYKISVPTVIEGKIEAPVVAPYDGFIRSANTKAGESVSEGQILAELEDQELLLAREKLLSQRNEKLNEYRTTLSKGERAQARLLKSQIAQIEGSIAESDLKITKSKISSPISGWVIAGDISRSIGAKVNQGDLLFKVSPLDEFRVMLKIPEKDIRFFLEGQRADLRLHAFPHEQLETKVVSISPLYSELDGIIVYLTEAEILAEENHALRPGME